MTVCQCTACWRSVCRGPDLTRDSAPLDGVVYAPQPALYCELFPTAVRCTGSSVGYRMAAVLLSSSTPALASALVVVSDGALWPVMIFATGPPSRWPQGDCRRTTGPSSSQIGVGERVPALQGATSPLVGSTPAQRTGAQALDVR